MASKLTLIRQGKAVSRAAAAEAPIIVPVLDYLPKGPEPVRSFVAEGHKGLTGGARCMSTSVMRTLPSGSLLAW